jgi:hypothetical protein
VKTMKTATTTKRRYAASATAPAPTPQSTSRRREVLAGELPAPLVPPEVDLRDFGYMPLDVLRLRDSDLAALATGEEFKAAVMLWCVAWHQVPAGSLPDDDRLLARYSGALTKWQKVKEQALRGFVKCSDGRLYHKTVSEKALDSWRIKQAKRERTKAATEALAAKRNAAKEERDGHGDDVRDDDRDVVQGKGIEGNGKGIEEQEKPARAATARTRQDASKYSHLFPIADRICGALTAMGIDKANARDESLLKLLAAGVTEEMFIAYVPKALEKGDHPFAYLLGTVEGQLRDGEKLRAELARPTSNATGNGHDMFADPTPKWAIDAGFANRFEAENEGCLPGNAWKYRNGKRVEQ